jgi:Flp pilus assembly protein CpaB
MTPTNTTTPPAPGGAKLMLVAIVLGIVAIVLTNIYIEMVRREVTEEGFVAYTLTRAVKRDTPLNKKYVNAVSVPSKFKDSFVRLGAINKLNFETVYLVQRSPFQRTVKEGELLTYAMFTGESGRNVDQHIRKGKRWIALPVNSVTVPGALRAGMFVDLEGTFPGQGALRTTLTVMERVEVMALGPQLAIQDADTTRRASTRRYRTLTIEVTPEEATDLSMIQRLLNGEFELHLRNPDDNQRPKIPNGGINPYLLDMINRSQQLPAANTDSRRNNWRRDVR